MSMPRARRGYASTAVLVRFVACLLPIRCRFVLSMRQSQIPIVRFNVLPFIGLQVPSTTNCQVSPSIVNDSDQLSIQPAEPVHHCNQVQESLCHPDIGDIRAPYLVDALHRGSSQQVGVDPQEPSVRQSLLLVSTRSLRRSGPLKVMKFPVTA